MKYTVEEAKEYSNRNEIDKWVHFKKTSYFNRKIVMFRIKQFRKSMI